MGLNARTEGKSAVLLAIALAGAGFASLAHAQVQRSFINLGFEQPVLTPVSQTTGCYVQVPEASVPGWTTNHPSLPGTGSCTSPAAGSGALIELWRNNFGGVPAREGVNFAELNAERAARLFQNICVTNGEQVRWQLSHRGRSGPGADVMSFNIDSSANQIMRGSTTPTGTGTVPAGSCGGGSVAGASCVAPTRTNTWADYTGTFAWNGTTGVHSFGFEAISAQGGISSGNFLDRIQVFLTPYVELLPSNNSGRESSGTVSVPTLVVTGNVATAFTVTLQVDPSSTAVLGTDFATPGGGSSFSVTVPAGNYDGGASSQFNVGIALIDNAVIENNRTIVLAVQPQPANYTIANSQTCGGTATQTLTYTILDDDVDLRTSKSASTAAPLAGGPFTYTVTYANNTARPTVAPLTAHDVTAPVSDAEPAGISFTSWTCTASGGASCPGGTVNGNTAGSGPIGGNAFLPAGNAAAGGSIAYTINAIANGAPNCGSITNTSTITTPSPFAEGTSVRGGFVSPVPGGSANNTAAAVVDPTCASTLSLSKVTLGAAAGPFGFALTNTTQAGGSTTTTAPGTPAAVDGDPAAGVQPFTIPPAGIGAPVTIQESAAPPGWGLQSASCAVGGSPVGSLSGGTLTIPVAVENADYVCTFTNARPRIRLQKALPDGRVLSGDQFQLTIAGPRNGAPAAATIATAGTGNVASGIADFNPADSGGTYTLSEAGVGSTILGLYNPSISCSNATAGSTTPLPSGQGASFPLTPAPNDDITCTIGNPKRPPTTVQVSKISDGGVGTFNFSGNNGFANQAITTTTPGAGVSAPAQTLTAGLTATTISEAAPPAGFALTSIACSGLGAGGAATPTIPGNGSNGGSVLLDAAATAPGSNIQCTFTNTRRTLTLAKTWVEAKLNDAVTVSTTGLANNASLAAVANTANETDTGTAVAVFAGETATIAETFTTGSAADYTTTLSCTGAADGNPNDGVTISATDTAIVCAQTNTRKAQSFNLAKTWVNGSSGHTATVTTTGGTTAATFSATAPTNASGTAVNLRAGDQVTLPVETFGGGATAAMYTTTVACAGGTTLAAAAPPQTITIASSTTATTCTYTNTRRRADLSISKTDGATTYTPGTQIIYTIVARNAGSEVASNAVVTDTLPATISNASWSVVYAGGASGPASGTGSINATVTLPVNAAATFTLTGTISASASGDLSNTAAIAAPSDLEDPDTANNSATDTDTRSGQADIEVVKTGTASAGYGAALSYDVVVTNHGPSDANGTTFSDTVPAGITDVAATCAAATGGAVCTPPAVAGNAVTGTIATLPANGSVTITITGNAPSSGTSVTNSASAQPPSGTTDPTPANNTGSATTTLLQPQLGVSKSATPNPFTVGQPASYTITLTNGGAGPSAGNVVVNDTLPAGITLVSAVGTNWACTGTTTLSCTFSGTLAAGASTTLTLNVAVAASAANGDNSAIASGGGDSGCPAAARCTGAVVVPVAASADIAVTKTVDNATPNVGETVTFTIAATNNGPSDATGVAITDALPSGLVFVSATPSQGSYDDATGLWSVGALANGANATLDISATVIATGSLTNTATRTGGDQFDPDPSNNSGSASVNGQPSADLQVQKTVDDAAPNVGSNVVFTVTVTNGGPNDASGVTLDDLLPGGLTFVSSTPSQGSYDNTTGMWNVGTLANGANATLAITVSVTQAGDITNTAAVGTSDQHDPNPANNSGGVTINGQSADIQVVKTVDNANPTVGDAITFTITTTNNGPSAATGVEITETLPNQLSLVSATPSQGTYAAASGIWTIGNLAATGPGATVTLTIVATVEADGAFTNTVAVSGSDQPDPVPSNNGAEVSILGVASADLEVVKTGPANATAGQNVSYTLVVTNHGPSDAAAVSLDDPTPAGLSFVSATAPCAAGFPCDLGTLANAGSTSVTVTFALPSNRTGDIENTATTSSPTGDPTPGNNISTVTTPVVASADLAVAKTGPATVTAAGAISYSVVVTNNGPSDADAALFSDPVAAGIGGVSATCGSATGGAVCGTVDVAGNDVSSTITTLPSGASVTFTIDGTAPAAATSLSNTATIAAPSGVPDPDSSNNASTATTTVNASANLSVAKSGPASAPPGTNVTYQLVVGNAGPSTATAVSLDDSTPAGLTFVSADAPCAAGFPCALGDLAAGASATVNVTYSIPSGQSGTIANTATATSPMPDPDPSDNTSTATTSLSGSADVSVTKTGPATVNAGGSITYTIVAMNAGPSDANGTTVGDSLPVGLTNASASCAGETGGAVCGAFDNTVAGTITTLPAGGSVTITITATAPNDATTLTNTATATPPAGTTDPTPGNNTSPPVETQVTPVANLSMSKSGPATLTSGAAIGYTLVIANAGPSMANGASYSDAVPAAITGVTAVCGSATGGAVCANPNVAGNTVSGTVPTLPSGGSVTITVTGTAPNGAQTLTNTASVTPPAGTTDPAPTDNTSTVTTEVGPAADIAVTKTVDEAAPNVGESVTFTLTATNNGPNDATGVEIVDGLPLGLTFVSATPSQGTYDDATGRWTVGALANGASASLQITATVTQAGAITNTATRTGGDQPDPNASNNSGSASVNAGTLADIQVAKSADGATPNLGADVTFTLAVTNAGPSPATGVDVTDLLPAGLTFVSATPSAGTYDDTTGQWTVGNLASGESQTLAIVATVTQAGEITNTATAAATEPDPNTSNNQSGTTINGQSADIQVVKTVDVAAPLVNGQVTYTVTVTNNGPSAATNVTATDALPAGLTFVNATPSQGTYASGTGLWTIGDLAASGAGATATLTIVATVNADQAGTTITNVATSAGGDQTDPTPGNNESQVPIVPAGQVDLGVTKTGPASATPGANVAYQLVVSNAGPSPAGQVSLADPTPAGLTFVSADAPCAAGFPCNLGDIVASASVTVNVTYAVPSGYAGADPIVNTATASSPTSDPNAANDTSTATTPVSRSADLSVTKTGPAAVAAGGTLSYTLVVTNAGPSDANGVAVSDPLPAGLSNPAATCGSETGGALCGAFDNTVAGTIATLPAGASATIMITATATAPAQGATLTNTATVTPPSGVTDPNTNDNTSTAVVTEVGAPTADLSTGKSGPSVIAPGHTLVYTIVVTNAGPNTAAAVQVTDPTPPGLSFVGNAGGCTTAYPCALGDLASGASVTITSTYEVPLDYAGPNPIANTATATSTTADPNSGNNGATAQTPVDTSGQVSDMMATGAPTQTVPVNTPVTVVTTCTNNGPLPAVGATCTVVEPIAPNAAGAAAGTLATGCTPATPVASLAVGATITCTTQFTPTQAGTWTLQTTAASQTPDAIPANNVAPSVVIAQAPDTADLGVVKQGPTTAAAGGTIVYTLSVTNHGPAAANDVTLDDPTPAGLTFVSAGAPCAGGFPCALGALASGQTATFTATYAIGAAFRGTITNTATAGSSTPDPSPANDSSRSATTVSPKPPVEQLPVPVDARWMLVLLSLLLTLAAGAGLSRRRG